MTEKKFNEMSHDEQIADLRKRVNQYMSLQLPGQPIGAHMGTTYLINDLLRTVERLSNGDSES